jgi:hypothetical protein
MPDARLPRWYEHRSQPLITTTEFALRVVRQIAVAQVLVAFSILLGMVGFRLTEGLGWLDGFLESAMLLAGMGPVHVPVTTAGKLFDGLFALYSGLVFIAVGGFILAPLFHRILHRLHADAD